jgi:hypothetical protein
MLESPKPAKVDPNFQRLSFLIVSFASFMR